MVETQKEADFEYNDISKLIWRVQNLDAFEIQKLQGEPPYKYRVFREADRKNEDLWFRELLKAADYENIAVVDLDSQSNHKIIEDDDTLYQIWMDIIHLPRYLNQKGADKQ